MASAATQRRELVDRLGAEEAAHGAARARESVGARRRAARTTAMAEHGDRDEHPDEHRQRAAGRRTRRERCGASRLRGRRRRRAASRGARASWPLSRYGASSGSRIGRGDRDEIEARDARLELLDPAPRPDVVAADDQRRARSARSAQRRRPGGRRSRRPRRARLTRAASAPGTKPRSISRSGRHLGRQQARSLRDRQRPALGRQADEGEPGVVLEESARSVRTVGRISAYVPRSGSKPTSTSESVGQVVDDLDHPVGRIERAGEPEQVGRRQQRERQRRAARARASSHGARRARSLIGRSDAEERACAERRRPGRRRR